MCWARGHIYASALLLCAQAYAAFIDRSTTVTHPLGVATGSLSTPDDIADLVTFLASSKAKFITGEVICVDGGRQCLGAR
jgi:NAD(P)-dependent dehydrogenase (short-subunit alcohol dehydrogenase family)